MNKTYLSADKYARDSFALARMILDSGWIPDEIIPLWRGGAPVGICVHEFLTYHGIHVRHDVLKCSSYSGIGENSGAVQFDKAEAVFDSLIPGMKVLVVDDVFDTGKTACAVCARLASCRVDFRFATVYWKPSRNITNRKPDYYVRETEEWLVFPHELACLSPAEIEKKDPVLYRLLDRSRIP